MTSGQSIWQIYCLRQNKNVNNEIELSDLHDSSISLLSFKSMLKTHLFCSRVSRLLRGVRCWVCICMCCAIQVFCYYYYYSWITCSVKLRRLYFLVYFVVELPSKTTPWFVNILIIETTTCTQYLLLQYRSGVKDENYLCLWSSLTSVLAIYSTTC